MAKLAAPSAAFVDTPRGRTGLALIADLKRNERCMAYQRLAPGAMPLLDEIEAKFPTDIHAQIQTLLLKMPIPAATGRKFKNNGQMRTLSGKSLENYIEQFHRIANMLRELNMPLKKMSHASAKHARHLLKKMHAEGKSHSWMGAIIGCFRRWCIWVGKTEAVPPMKQLVADCKLPPGTGVRTYGAVSPKTLRSKGIDFHVVLARAQKNCYVTHLQLGTQIYFGCRVKESSFLEPFKCDEGNWLHIFKGAKGGHERRVPVRTEEQRAWLDLVKEYAKTHPKQILTLNPMRTWRQAKRHFYTVMESIGLTNAGEFHCTAHALRHEYLCRRYEELAGSLPPVEGGELVDYETHERVAKIVIKEGGHHSETKMQAYAGNYHQFSAKDKRVAALYKRCKDPRVQSELRELGVTGLLLVGEAAAGLIKPEATTICAYECEGDAEARDFVRENYDSLLALLQMIIGTRVEVTPRTAAHQAAQHTLEIAFEPCNHYPAAPFHFEAE